MEDVEVEGLETPLGFLITRCSRVPGQLKCTRACATQLDAVAVTDEAFEEAATQLRARGSLPVFPSNDVDEPEWAPYPVLAGDGEIVESEWSFHAPANDEDVADDVDESEWAPYLVGQ